MSKRVEGKTIVRVRAEDLKVGDVILTSSGVGEYTVTKAEAQRGIGSVSGIRLTVCEANTPDYPEHLYYRQNHLIERVV